jgi:hypothetical protein
MGMRTLLLVPFVVLLAACGAEQEPAAEQAGAPAAETSPAPLPDVAEIVCGSDGVQLLTPRVATQPDGVHVSIRNETGAPFGIAVETESAGFGNSIPAGESEAVWPEGPGTLRVSCGDGTTDGAGEELEVIDEGGYWAPYAIEDCANVETAQLDYIADAPGEKGEPTDVARKYLGESVQEGDTVELAGYESPGENNATWVRLVRDGKVVAAVDLMKTPDGGWLVNTVSTCKDA